MKFKSQLFTQGSGSIGGLTVSRNRGGLYIRARAIPVNPGTIRQTVVRLHMSNLSNRWVNELTPAQRDTWDSYAENVQIPDTLGEPRNAGGLGMFVRSNLPRLMAGLTIVLVAPTIFDLGDFTQITAPTATDAPELGFTYVNADEWANEDQSAMLVFGGRPVNQTINYYKGPWRFAGLVQGDIAIPPVPPAAIPSPHALVAGQKVFFRVQVTREDGRYSTEQRTFAVVTSAAIRSHARPKPGKPLPRKPVKRSQRKKS